MMTLENEQAAFDAQREELIQAGHQGEFVLFKDGHVVHLYASDSEAYQAGITQYGPGGTFLIDRVEPKTMRVVSLTWELGLMNGA